MRIVRQQIPPWTSLITIIASGIVMGSRACTVQDLSAIRMSVAMGL